MYLYVGLIIQSLFIFYLYKIFTSLYVFDIINLYAHKRGVSVEAEIGKLAGVEDDVIVEENY